MSRLTLPLKIVSYLGLLLTVGPSFLVFAGTIGLETYYQLTLVGTLLWITTAPFWINKSDT